MSDFKISLAAARVNAKMTQEVVAKKLRVSKTTVVSWENGKTAPSITQFAKMCELYQCPLDVIFLPPL